MRSFLVAVDCQEAPFWVLKLINQSCAWGDPEVRYCWHFLAVVRRGGLIRFFVENFPCRLVSYIKNPNLKPPKDPFIKVERVSSSESITYIQHIHPCKSQAHPVVITAGKASICIWMLCTVDSLWTILTNTETNYSYSHALVVMLICLNILAAPGPL